MPGPGVYEIKPTKEGPSYSFRPKIEAKLKNFVPGPGNYEPKVTLTTEKTPSWIVGKSEQRTISAGKDSVYLPGPGTYQKPSTLGGPKWRFGDSTRNALRSMAVPGPGSYEIKSTVGNSPSYLRT